MRALARIFWYTVRECMHLEKQGGKRISPMEMSLRFYQIWKEIQAKKRNQKAGE